MDEKVIMSGKSDKGKKSAKVGIIIGLLMGVGGFILYFLLFNLLDSTIGNAAARATTPIFTVIMVIGVILVILFAILYFAIAKCSISITSSKVYGCAVFGKHVDIPVVSISTVSTGSFDSIVITTSTKTIKFFGISNKNELCEHISKLLAGCQRRAFTQSTANEGTVYADTQGNEEILKAVKTAICAQLKSPASAQFPVDMITIVGDETRGYHITGYVDSQNGYGAMIRNDFAADITIENGRPIVKSCSVAANANKARAKAFGVNYIALLIIVGVVGVLLYFLISMMVGL